jgi:PAS domain S-box-containing protein
MTRETRDWQDPPDPHAEAAGAALRQHAEGRLRALDSLPQQVLRPEEAVRLVHELRVHEIELELQNEELRRAQEALENSRARFFDLYDLAPVGYLTLTERGLIRDANLAAARILGVPRSGLVNFPLSSFIRPEDFDRLYHCRQDLLDTGQQQTCELCLRRQDDSSVAIQLHMTLGVDRETGAAHCLTVLTDISKRKCAEALQREEDQRKEGFIAMLGHELRNPLAPIRHVAETLRLAVPPNPRQLQQAGEILSRQVGHLTRLVDDLLDVARIGRGGIPLAKQPCDLREATQTAAEQLRPLLDNAQQRLALRLPDEPVMVHGDPVRLAQAVANLLRNASQFSAPGSAVTLELEVTEDCAELRVQDQGVGLDPIVLSRLFEPFVQTGQTMEHVRGGLGMGLALAKGLVESHGGTIVANSAGPGQGSTFSVRLPSPSMARTDVMPASQAGKPVLRRVLVVEDNTDVADACVMLLQTMGHEADAVADGPAALSASERLHPDLILVDLGLPGMDGFEVARRLRGMDSGRTARLVAVTGHGQDRERSRTAGFDEHLLKPVGQAALVALLARCRTSAARQ